MTLSELERAVHVRDPEPPSTEGLAGAIADSVHYLDSDAALRSIERDTYWPKWDSPWWHMLLLWELGEAHRIPARAVRAMVDGLKHCRSTASRFTSTNGRRGSIATGTARVIARSARWRRCSTPRASTSLASCRG